MKKFWKTFGFGLVAFAAACGQEEAQEPNEPVDPALASAIEGNLGTFENDPTAFMNSLPVKFMVSPVQPFTAEAASSGVYLDRKDEGRDLMKVPVPKDDAPGLNDQARNLVDNGATLITKLTDMHSMRSATLAESPWSDDYWALYSGSIAKRYADPDSTYTDNWKNNVANHRKGLPKDLDNLSPAEKYDLLLGTTDPKKGMTEYNLMTGAPYADAQGKVETWMGICHGWAPVAYMIPRAQKAVTVKAADGVKDVKFYPSDIKALGSLLWANARSSTKFIGGRCNVKNPAKDSIGRIKDTACRDTNAGTWHTAVVNQIGKNKRSMVLDATFDYEVWNQPVYGYSYVYFNPKTNRSTSTISYAKVAVADFPTDKFKAYRAAGTTHIVGVAMDVKWVVETQPSHNTPDSPSRDAISGARYLYTLELDSAGNVIGGEWLQNAHPDFLWTPPPGAKATSIYDAQARNVAYDGKAPVDASWRTAAAAGASQNGLPLAIVVEKLTALARQ